MRIIFLGTPAFAVPSLEILIKNNYRVVAVITAPDAPAGRGLKTNMSAVKEFALKHGLEVLQPVKLSDPDFLLRVKSYDADLQIVVAFRMMPQKLWAMPPSGTFNLHASLLPAYRGAAPINHAIMNGEKKTGVTTFFLRHEIDTGAIIIREEMLILPEDTAGTLHDRLMVLGADVVLKTVRQIESGHVVTISQEDLIKSGEAISDAPKIYKEDCKVDLNGGVIKAHNKIRGLSPHPGAYIEFKDMEGNSIHLKVFRSSFINDVHQEIAVKYQQHAIALELYDGTLLLEDVQMPGKKRMSAEELLRGFNFFEKLKLYIL